MSTSIAVAHDLTCLPFASQYSAFPTSRAGRVAFSEDLYRFLSHLRMPCFNFTSYISPSAVSHRSVHVIRVSTRRNLALRGLCAYRVFDPRFVSCWPMFADLDSENLVVCGVWEKCVLACAKRKIECKCMTPLERYDRLSQRR